MWVKVAFTASVVVSLSGAVVSAWEIFFGGFRPNLVSRTIWTAATAIGFATAVAGGAGMAAIPIAGLTAGSLLVTIAAYAKASGGTVERIDFVCGAIAAAGLIAWKFTGDPGLATAAAIAVDAIAAIPTFRHVVRQPQEESWMSYSFGGVSAAIGLAALETWNFATAAFSIYLVVLCSSLVALIIFGRRRTPTAEGTPIGGAA